jgi:hypothetical protein
MATNRPSHATSQARASRAGRVAALTASGLLCGIWLASACDSQGTSNDTESTAALSQAGSAGTTGKGAPSNGAGGSSAKADAGTARLPLNGTITELSADPALHGPTTAALRGKTLFVVNGQLDQFPAGQPVLPFDVVSLPVSGGALGERITLPGNAFFPDGIAAAPDGSLFIGSLNEQTILRVPDGSTTPDGTPFVSKGIARNGVMGLAVESGDRHLLWFCDSNPSQRGAALVGVNLDSGTEAVRHEVPKPMTWTATDAGADAATDASSDASYDAAAGMLSDAGGDAGTSMTRTSCHAAIVDTAGNVLFSDASGRVLRVASTNALISNSAKVWLRSPLLEPKGPSRLGAKGLALVSGHLIISSNDELFAADPTSKSPASTLRPIRLSENGEAKTLCGPDGLAAVPNSNTELIVVENGSCAGSTQRARVVRVALDLAQ